MKKEAILLAVVQALIDESISKIKFPELSQGQRGPRGHSGRDGNDFNIEDHKETIQDFVKSLIPTKIELTEEQINSLKGSDGKDFNFEEYRDSIVSLIKDNIPQEISLTDEQIFMLKGRDGKSGRDGRDFVFEECKDKIEEIIKSNLPTEAKITEEQLESLKGEKGLPGKDGINGKDFVFEENREVIEEIIKSNLPKEISITDEQLASLKGERGSSGRDGRDFDFEENREVIEEIIKSNLPTEVVVTDDQLEKITGPKGKDGTDGKDFVFEENKEKIDETIIQYISSVEDRLKLRFSDLTDEDKESLRGPRGQRGKAGRDFDLEESKPFIEKTVKDSVNELAPELKLKFSDLSDEEKDSLKLKFSELSEAEKFSLRGSRGQRGKAGKDGHDGINGKSAYQLWLDSGNVGEVSDFILSLKGARGERGIRGIPGLGYPGPKGLDGINGKDGKDAPKITDVVLNEFEEQFSFTFYFNNGTKLSTQYIDIPRSKIINNHYVAGGGINYGADSGGGSGNTILNGVGVPSALLGNDDDFYLDTATYDFYGPKTAGAWGTPTNLIGPQGPAGTNGANGTNGTNGTDGTDGVDGTDGKSFLTGNGAPLNTLGNDGDSYLDTDSGDIYQKTAGVWNYFDTIPTGTGSSIEAYDEGVLRVPEVSGINLIGNHAELHPEVPISEWALLSDVTTMSDYYPLGGGPYVTNIHIKDQNVLEWQSCAVGTYLGAWVKANSSKVFSPALADSMANSNVTGVVIRMRGSNLCDVLAIPGITPELFSGLDVNADYYLSSTIAGAMQSTPPVTPGNIRLRLGQPFGTTQLNFNRGERVIVT